MAINRCIGGLRTLMGLVGLIDRHSFPAVLSATAETEDGVIMAIEHKSLPIAAVQFHPESVMTSPGEIGMPILETALSVLCEKVEA